MLTDRSDLCVRTTRRSFDQESLAMTIAQVGLRERILDHALREFAERGYEAASLASIAQSAGSTKQNVLYHFRSKEALLDSVLAEVFACIDELTAELNDPDSDVDPALGICTLLSENRQAVQLVLFHLSTLPDPSIVTRVLELFGLVARLLAPERTPPTQVTVTALAGMAYAVAAYDASVAPLIPASFGAEFLTEPTPESLAILLRQMTGTMPDDHPDRPAESDNEVR